VIVTWNLKHVAEGIKRFWWRSL